MKNKIEKLIIDSANELNCFLENKLLVANGANCVLYGKNGILDSISLVTLVAKVEEKIEDEFDVSIILADEKAMSQKRSPFLTIDTLTTYVESLISKEVGYA